MPDPSSPSPAPDASAAFPIPEVRYSLPALLAELKLERTTGAFAMEKLDQSEIGKLFQPKPSKRRASARSR